jgi:hypothetical protein
MTKLKADRIQGMLFIILFRVFWLPVSSQETWGWKYTKP